MLDKLIRAAAFSWFVGIAWIAAVDIGEMLSAVMPLTGVEYARLAAKASLVSFLAMMGYLTLVRWSPVARARGWQPRVSALLGTNLVFMGLLFLTPRGDLSPEANLLSAGLILTGNILCVYV